MPNPDPKQLLVIERRAKRIISKYALRSIELSLSNGVSARAMPDAYSPMVVARRERELAEAATARGGSLSMSEANEIVTAALRPIATGHGSDIAAALTSLETALKKVME